MLAVPSAIAQPGKLSNIARHCPRGGGTSAAIIGYMCYQYVWIDQVMMMIEYGDELFDASEFGPFW